MCKPPWEKTILWELSEFRVAWWLLVADVGTAIRDAWKFLGEGIETLASEKVARELHWQDDERREWQRTERSAS